MALSMMLWGIKSQVSTLQPVNVAFQFLCKGKSLDTSYSATYMTQTRDQQRFTISEVAADRHVHVTSGSVET